MKLRDGRDVTQPVIRALRFTLAYLEHDVRLMVEQIEGISEEEFGLLRALLAHLTESDD